MQEKLVNMGSGYMFHGEAAAVSVLLAFPFFTLLVFYVTAVLVSNRTKKRWPVYRTACWIAGILCALASVFGPVAEQSHHQFHFHMVSHLLLGMLAPLLMATSAPVTLLLRTVGTKRARKLVKLLKSKIVRFFSSPVTAALLNIGGLWVLYTTNMFAMMHDSVLLYAFIHIHIFVAGCLFTASIISSEPGMHHTSFICRAIVLIIALAGHSILAKYIYANPPAGIVGSQAELGAILMYYGGDVIDMVIIFVLLLNWYKSTRPKTVGRANFGSVLQSEQVKT